MAAPTHDVKKVGKSGSFGDFGRNKHFSCTDRTAKRGWLCKLHVLKHK